MPGLLHLDLPGRVGRGAKIPGGVDVLTFHIAQAKADIELLLHALLFGERDKAVIVAVRLRCELGDVERTALVRALNDHARYDELVSGAVQLQDEAQLLLDLLPRASSDAVVVRRYLARMGTACLSRYRRSHGSAINASSETLSDLMLKHADLQSAKLIRATLRNVVAPEANLTRALAPGITLLHVDLSGSCLQGATLDGCRAEDSCFVAAEMSFAVMGRATAARCDFRRAVLREVNLERAAFIACDFRGATFDASRFYAGTTGASFLRCDLRGTSWGQRDLTGVRFEDCKMSGLRGTPRTKGVIVVRPDLSSAGDGSATTTSALPETLWPGVP